MPSLKDHGLDFVDPFEKMKMKDKSLKDMGSENFDLSALSHDSLAFVVF
jgi:hypothetical protein